MRDRSCGDDRSRCNRRVDDHPSVNIERAVVGALRHAIRDHGPITPEQIGSAAKRIVGNLKNARCPGCGLAPADIAELAASDGSASTATLARLEIAGEELARALDPEFRDRIVQEIKAAGYQHVTIDLQGYRRGSLNEGLRLKPV